MYNNNSILNKKMKLNQTKQEHLTIIDILQGF